MIKSQITLKQLEAFAFVVDKGTFRAAAEALGTTQPNISARIAALETALGVTLLIRDAGSVRLTGKGKALLKKAREVIWAGEALLEEAGRQNLIDERLRLGVTELVACTWLQAFLRHFKQAYPAVQVELQVDLSTEIETRLLTGELDLAFQTGPFKTVLSGTKLLSEEKYIWCATPDLAAQVGPAPSLQTVFDFPILTHAKHTQAGHAIHDLVHQRGFNNRQIVHSSALSACVPMVCEGLGIALLPEALVRTELAEGQLKAIKVDWLPDPLKFYARYDATRTPRLVAYAASCAETAIS